jgi:hypothetical protein
VSGDGFEGDAVAQGGELRDVVTGLRLLAFLLASAVDCSLSDPSESIWVTNLGV